MLTEVLYYSINQIYIEQEVGDRIIKLSQTNCPYKTVKNEI